MTKPEQHEQEQRTLAAPGEAALGAHGAARRRFARAGVGASGVILTLASQPGMAANSVCTTPSGFLSKPMTSHTPSGNCGGRSPGYWKNHHDEWKSRASTEGTKPFKTEFPGKAALNSYSLFDIVDPTKVTNGADPDNVAMHIVAALLNARAGWTSLVLNEKKVHEIWAQYAVNSYYTPTPGAQPWYGAKIVQYLTSTFALEDQHP